jgi:antitoxin ChpS
MMQLGIGDQLALEIANGALVARPVKNARKRYKLSELLQGSDAMSSLNAEVAWAMKGDPVGHEIT